MMSMLKRTVRAALRGTVRHGIVREPSRRLARAGILPDAVWKRLPVEQTYRVQTASGASFLYTSTAGDLIGRHLYWTGLYGAWEAETVQVFERLASRADTIVDIGANTGVFSLLACAANPAARVIAFEPVPRLRDRLAAQVAQNGWAGRCGVRPEAVSDRTGHTTFHVPGEETPTSGSMDPAGFRGVDGNLIEVPVTTMDDIARDLGEIDLVKIDVEGFEDTVLAGMPGTLSRSRPSVIFEVNPDGPYARVEASLRAHGYRLFHLRDGGPAAVETVAPDPSGRFRNYLGVAREDVLAWLHERSRATDRGISVA